MIKIAFIGAGSIAGTHAAALDRGQVEIVAAVDVVESAAGAFAEKHGGKPFGSLDGFFDALAGGLTVDAAILCTPPSTRLGVIARLAEHGIHTLVEKPLASSPGEAEKIGELAAAKPDLLIAVGFCHRFAPAVQAMRDLVGQGKIGRLIRFENTFAFHHPPMAEKWFSDPAISGGGSLMDAGCHSVDLFHFLVGPSKAVGAVFDTPWAGRGESGATALLRCTEGAHAGAVGVITSGWMEGERFDVRLVGDGGSLSYDYMKPSELVFSPLSGQAETIEVEPHDLRFPRQLAHFFGLCRGGAGSARAPMAGVDDGIAAARTIDGAIKLAVSAGH